MVFLYGGGIFIKKLYIIGLIIVISLAFISKQTTDITYYKINNIADNTIQNKEPMDDEIINEPEEKDEKILKAENFLYKLHQEEIKEINFTAYQNLNKNYSFIYFITATDPKITEALVSIKNKNTRPGITRDKINYIVIHDTGNTSASATAKAHMNYITTSNVNKSWHYTIEENTIYQHIPDNEVAYHAGDGTRDIGEKWYSETYKKQNNGGGNLRGIGIETCVNSGSDYLKTINSTAKLSAYLLYKYNLTIDELKTHYDFSGKECPYLLIKDDYFELLKTWTSYYLEAFEVFKDVNVSYISKSTNLDKDGFVTNTADKKVKYQVSLEYQGKKYIYYFETQIK